jgi:hypothetical protein
MKAKLRTSTTAPAVACAVALAATAIAADTVTVPAPSVRWDPVENGTTVPNTGTREGFARLTDGALLLRKATVPNLAIANCAPADLVTPDGAGPFGRGRAIDFSANPGNGPAPIFNTDPARAAPLAGLVSTINGGLDLAGARDLTVTLWYKLDSSLTAEDRYVLLFRHNAFGLGFLRNGGPSFTTSVKNASGTFEAPRLDAPPNATLLQPGKWVFLAGAWNGDTGRITLYYGNEEKPVAMLKTAATATRGVLGDPGAKPNPYMNLGFFNNGDTGNNGRRFDGWLADIRIYSAALSTEQLEKVRTTAATSATTGAAAAATTGGAAATTAIGDRTRDIGL